MSISFITSNLHIFELGKKHSVGDCYIEA